MPSYSYKAIDDAGKVFKGTFVAFNDEDVEQRLLKKGLTLIKSRKANEGGLFSLQAGGKVKPRFLVEFYHRLAQTLDLGLSLVPALDENAKMLPSKPLKKALDETRAGLEGGRSLYESMSRFPRIFQKLDLAVIRMGEQSGVLPKCMEDLADFLEWKEDIRSIMKRATIYPFFIVLVLTAVVGVWVGYVLPQMAQMLTDMGIALPAVTQAVFTISLFVQANWPIILGALFAVVAAFVLFMKTRVGALLIHRYWLKLPVVGNVAVNIAVARLSRNFATMFGAGMNVNYIFEILTDRIIGNRYLEEQLKKAFQGVQRGQTIADALETVGGFPPLLIGGIRTGETTGTLEPSFGRLGTYYDGEVKRAIQTLINAIEPVTIILLGGVFGLIALSIMLPLYDVIGGMGNTF